MGPSTVLTGKAEEELVTWLIEIAKCGFSQRKQDLLSAVRKLLVKKEEKPRLKNNETGEKWYQSFLKRHKNIALKKLKDFRNQGQLSLKNL